MPSFFFSLACELARLLILKSITPILGSPPPKYLGSITTPDMPHHASSICEQEYKEKPLLIAVLLPTGVGSRPFQDSFVLDFL